MTRGDVARDRMLRASALVALACAPLAASVLHAQQMPTGFTDREIVAGALRLPYQLYVPASYDSARRSPVILFLHGAGERGADGLRQTEVGIGTAVRRHREWFPAIVVMPQCPADSIWHGAVEDAAFSALQRTIDEMHGDPHRVYVAGLSMGGYGAWQMAVDHPGVFAAIVTAAGGVTAPPNMKELFVHVAAADPFQAVAERVRGVPAWLFHGADDPVVPVTQSRRLVEALRAAGSPVRYTEYPGVGHDSWDSAFAEPELWRWVFAQRTTR